MSDWPTTCAEVTWEHGNLGDERRPWYEGEVGDLLWNPKGGEGHVLVSEVACGSPCGTGEHPNSPAHCMACGTCIGYGFPTGGRTRVCECGEDDGYRDHHYWLLARKP